jgi:hypothetical protein
MLKTATILVISAVSLASIGGALAQSDNHAAPGVRAPNAPRYLPNGEVEPPPSMRSNGGVGSQFNPYNDAQTRSGGPSGGGNQGGGL